MLYALESRLTILRDRTSPADPHAADLQSGAQALALSALGWVLGDDARAQRLLALTGLDPDGLRQRLGDAALLGAVIDFLCAHEPDLVAAAAALGVEPQELADTRARLTA